MSNTGGTPNKDGQQPKLEPLDVNGITAVTIGTIAWAIALVVLLLARGWLADTGRTHWIWIAASGVVLGLLGYGYTTRRVKRLGLSKKSEPDQSQLIHDFE
jgi:hypothetical protein